MIEAHIIDSLGVYIRTEALDPMGPQPAGAIYADLPEEVEGRTRLWMSGEWRQVPDSEVPVPSAPQPLIPEEVTMAQCRLALFDKHSIETDEQFYALSDILPEADRARARLELRTRPTVRWDNPLVIAFCAAMGWDRDELFIYGAAQ